MNPVVMAGECDANSYFIHTSPLLLHDKKRLRQLRRYLKPSQLRHRAELSALMDLQVDHRFTLRKKQRVCPTRNVIFFLARILFCYRPYDTKILERERLATEFKWIWSFNENIYHFSNIQIYFTIVESNLQLGSEFPVQWIVNPYHKSKP
jgi:hypothetical protein